MCIRDRYKDNFNRAYKRVKANKGAPGIDGMTIEEALPYLSLIHISVSNYLMLAVYRMFRRLYQAAPGNVASICLLYTSD